MHVYLKIKRISPEAIFFSFLFAELNKAEGLNFCNSNHFRFSISRRDKNTISTKKALKLILERLVQESVYYRIHTTVSVSNQLQDCTLDSEGLVSISNKLSVQMEREKGKPQNRKGQKEKDQHFYHSFLLLDVSFVVARVFQDIADRVVDPEPMSDPPVAKSHHQNRK